MGYFLPLVALIMEFGGGGARNEAGEEKNILNHMTVWILSSMSIIKGTDVDSLSFFKEK